MRSNHEKEKTKISPRGREGPPGTNFDFFNLAPEQPSLYTPARSFARTHARMHALGDDPFGRGPI